MTNQLRNHVRFDIPLERIGIKVKETRIVNPRVLLDDFSIGDPEGKLL